MVVVTIDPASIAKIGTWPWPRQIHADLVEKLQAAGVNDIVFDVDFSTPSNITADTAFANALKAAGGSVTNLDGSPLTYGHYERGFRNPHFVAWGRQPPWSGAVAELPAAGA